MKILNFEYNSIEVSSYGSNWQYPSIGLDYNMGTKRRQVIIWTNADPIHRRIYAAQDGVNYDQLRKA